MKFIQIILINIIFNKSVNKIKNQRNIKYATRLKRKQ